MTLLFATLCLMLCVSICSCGPEWSGLTGKFTTKIFGKHGFYTLPLTKQQALASNPAFMSMGVQDKEFNVDIYCLPANPHVCLLMDTHGQIAGLRITHLKDELTSDPANFPYVAYESSLFNTTYTMGSKAWYTNFFFTNPENLRHGKPPVNRPKGEFADGLWVRLESGWTEIPRDECDARKQGYTKQGFIPWMGNHYTYGRLDDCSKFLPILPIYHKGRLIALSFAPIGKHIPLRGRDWLEDVPANVIPKIVPNGYQYCLQKWTQLYSASSFHFYFTKYPRWILFNRSKSCR